MEVLTSNELTSFTQLRDTFKLSDYSNIECDTNVSHKYNIKYNQHVVDNVVDNVVDDVVDNVVDKQLKYEKTHVNDYSELSVEIPNKYSCKFCQCNSITYD